MDFDVSDSSGELETNYLLHYPKECNGHWILGILVIVFLIDFVYWVWIRFLCVFLGFAFVAEWVWLYAMACIMWVRRQCGLMGIRVWGLCMTLHLCLLVFLSLSWKMVFAYYYLLVLICRFCLLLLMGRRNWHWMKLGLVHFNH